MVVLLAALLPAGVVSAQQSRGTGRVCPPPGQQSQDRFSDDDGSVHQNNINCVAGYQVAQGTDPDNGEYSPGQPISRAQMATFIAKFVETAVGGSLPSGDDAFADDGESVHHEAINKVANAGIVSGRGGDQYDPADPVDRAAMATFIARAIDVVDDGDADNGSLPPSSDQDFFGDDRNSVHHGNINRLAGQNIVSGTGAGYEPTGDVSRAQMTTFVMQGADYLAEGGLWAPTSGVSVTVDTQQVEQGGQVSGAITSSGRQIDSAAVSGCGVNDRLLQDNDDQAAGLQFSFAVPDTQQPGDCDLTFAVADGDRDQTSRTETITVVEAAGRSTVRLGATTVEQGGHISGEIVASDQQSSGQPGQQSQQQDGTTVESATVAGCGLEETQLEDTDGETDGIQFTVGIRRSTEPGECTMTFTVNFADG